MTCLVAHVQPHRPAADQRVVPPRAQLAELAELCRGGVVEPVDLLVGGRQHQQPAQLGVRVRHGWSARPQPSRRPPPAASRWPPAGRVRTSWSAPGRSGRRARWLPAPPARPRRAAAGSRSTPGRTPARVPARTPTRSRLRAAGAGRRSSPAWCWCAWLRGRARPGRGPRSGWPRRARARPRRPARATANRPACGSPWGSVTAPTARRVSTSTHIRLLVPGGCRLRRQHRARRGDDLSSGTTATEKLISGVAPKAAHRAVRRRRTQVRTARAWAC